MISRRPTAANGKKATKPSRKRITPRDQRAVVMRCTAENMTPAEAIVVKNSQFIRKACHARAWPVMAP